MDIEFLAAKELKAAAQSLSLDEARYLVDRYYQIQEMRKATGNQVRSLDTDEPGDLLGGINESMIRIEGRIKKGLDYYTDTQDLSVWAKSIIGIGPVLSAGLLAHINFTPWRCQNHPSSEKCTMKEPCGAGNCGPTRITSAAHIWRFAGLDPTSKWEKGNRRPWNAELKKLCWLIGESFVKVSGNPKSLYGGLYVKRKDYEAQKNEAGDYKQQAEAALLRIGKSTESYKSYKEGKLPKGHLHSRAKRWAVKIFLCHYFEKGYELYFNEKPPTIYSIAMMGHVDKIEAEGSKQHTA